MLLPQLSGGRFVRILPPYPVPDPQDCPRCFLLIFCHVLACMFYAIAIATEEHDDVPKTWVTFFDGGYMQEEATPVFDAYIIAYLWAVGLVCGRRLTGLKLHVIEWPNH